jgi:diguanylate cyclase (GGDEF)-like protein/PAS domain S-box-containing protein
MIRVDPVQVTQQLELCSGSEHREPQQKVSILLVDDNPDNLLLLEEILKPLAQNLVKAHSGEEALSCLLRQEFAVIILDVQMPGMDGLTTAGLIRKRKKNQKTPIIFLTAFNYSVTSVFKGCQVGTVDYLFQPIVPEILLSKVTLFIDLFKQTQAIKRKASLALFEREEQLSLAVDAAQMGIWDWDLVTNKLTLSQQYERIFGFEPGTFQLHPDVFFTCIHPNDRDKFTQALSVARENKTSYNQDVRILWSNGNIRWVCVKGKFLYNEISQPTRMIGVIVDITSQKVAAEEQQKAKDELEQKLQKRTEELIEINERLQRELFKRERQYRKLREQTELLDLVQDTIITKDLNGTITFWNHSAEELYGFSREEALGKVAHELLQTQFPIPLSDIKTMLFEKGKWEGEILQTKFNGDKVVVHSRWIIQRDLGGRPIKILEIANDISDRKAAEIALQESEARFQTFMNHSPAATWMTDADGHILYHNNTYERVFQHMGGDASDGTAFDACYIESAKVRIDQVKYVVQTNQVLETVESALRKDGTLGEFLVCRFPMNSNSDQCLVGGVALDITEYKRAERALKDSEAQFRAAAEGSLDAFFVLQSVRNETERIVDFTLVNLNSKAEDLISTFRERVIGAKLSELFPETYTSKCFEKCVRVVETQKVLHKELCVSIPNIKAEWIQYQIVPLADGVAITARDITESKKAEAELQRANAQLTAWVQELERRNTEIAMLGEMSDILQACLTVEEAHNVLSQLVQPLFPELSGGVFIINSSKRLVDAVATWGDAMLNSQKVFTPNECWALRRGRVHRVDKSHSNLQCKHVHHDAHYAESLCVPMMAQGEAMGILYLSSPQQGLITPAIEQLAVTVAEHIALALANLKLHEALEQQSIRDALTGLFNRHYLEESLERELCRAERKQQSLGIIMIDVDHFKRFNDTFGHEAGDTVLRELGTFLKQQVRGSDIACRYGGEEIILILLEASLEAAKQRAEQIREGAKHLILKNRNQLLGAITLSLGVACFPEHGLTGEAVIQAADAALYRAKQEGRDRVITASDESCTNTIRFS